LALPLIRKRTMAVYPFGREKTTSSRRRLSHARYYWLLLAESHLTQRLFGSMVRRMEALPVPSG